MGFEIEDGDTAVDGVQGKRDYDGCAQDRVRSSKGCSQGMIPMTSRSNILTHDLQLCGNCFSDCSPDRKISPGAII